MAVKILLPPQRKGDSFIVGEEGKLRIVDTPRNCWGRRSCCCCPRCTKADATKRKKAAKPRQVCVCETPVVHGGTCIHCGRPPIAAARVA